MKTLPRPNLIVGHTIYLLSVDFEAGTSTATKGTIHSIDSSCRDNKRCAHVQLEGHDSLSYANENQFRQPYMNGMNGTMYSHTDNFDILLTAMYEYAAEKLQECTDNMALIMKQTPKVLKHALSQR